MRRSQAKSTVLAEIVFVENIKVQTLGDGMPGERKTQVSSAKINTSSSSSVSEKMAGELARFAELEELLL